MMTIGKLIRNFVPILEPDERVDFILKYRKA